MNIGKFQCLMEVFSLFVIRAEGFGRFHFQENMQFCRISRGSLYELIDQLITSLDDKYITTEEYEKGRSLISKALPLLNGYIRYLSREKSK